MIELYWDALWGLFVPYAIILFFVFWILTDEAIEKFKSQPVEVTEK